MNRKRPRWTNDWKAPTSRGLRMGGVRRSRDLLRRTSYIHFSRILAGCLLFSVVQALALAGTGESVQAGKYTIMVGGIRVGEEQYILVKTRKGRRLTVTTKFRTPVQDLDQEVTLDLDAQDRPLSLRATDRRGEFAATFSDGQVEITGAGKMPRPWPDGFLVRYPNCFHHVALVLAHAPKVERGSAAYAATVHGAPIVVIKKGTQKVSAGDRSLTLRRYWLVVRGQRSAAWTDEATDQMVQYEVPAIGLRVIASGYEDVLANLADEPVNATERGASGS